MVKMIQNAVGRKAAILVCDVCLERIADASYAAAVFKSESNVGDIFDVLHAHKGACHDEAEKRLGGKAQTGWEEMKVHLIQVCHNASSPVASLARMDALYEQVGELP
jgi:hypothetical protein